MAISQGATADWPAIAATVEGKPPAGGLADLKSIGMVVVAYPYRCGERLLPPLGLALHGQTGGPLPRAQMDPLSPDQVSPDLGQ